VILRQRGGKTAVNQCNATAPANGVPCSGGTEHAASGWCRRRQAPCVGGQAFGGTAAVDDRHPDARRENRAVVAQLLEQRGLTPSRARPQLNPLSPKRIGNGRMGYAVAGTKPGK
jgi:hypothetical protein